MPEDNMEEPGLGAGLREIIPKHVTLSLQNASPGSAKQEGPGAEGCTGALIVLAAAADPADRAAFGEALLPRFYGPDGSPAGVQRPGRFRSRLLTPEEQRRADEVPPFDLGDDEFMAIMCTNSAPVDARKRATPRSGTASIQRALRPRLATREVGP